MKIDAINFGAFSDPTPLKPVVVEETGNSPIPSDYDDTRLAGVNPNNVNVTAPIEKTNGTVEDLMQAQISTEHMARSYGFANLAEAQAVTSPVTSAESSSAVSAVSGASAGGINA